MPARVAEHHIAFDASRADSDDAPPCRRFSLGDAMILIAALAVWFSMASSMASASWQLVRSIPFGRLLSGWSAFWLYLTRTNWGVTLSLLMYAHNIGLAFLMVTSLAFAMLRLRRPRPRLAQVGRQPGMVAIEAMFATFVLTSLVEIVQPPMSRLVFPFLFLPLPLAWGWLALSGRWRREPGWIDRLGIALGVGWCLETALFVTMFLRYFG